MNSNGFKALFEPINIGELKIKNRIVSAPHTTYYVDTDGFINDRVTAYYTAVARGGSGLIILGHLPPTPSVPQERPIGIYDDKFIPSLSKFVDAIHGFGCQIFAQINHPGPDGGKDLDGGPPLSASTIGEDVLPSPKPIFNPPRGLEISEIEIMEDLFAKAAKRAQLAGFDGIELHASHTYLLASFLTRIWNKREDDYGYQNVENRTRIVREILAKIKSSCGQHFPVGVRVNG